MPRMTIAGALQLMKHRQYQVREIGKAPQRWRRILDALRPGILRKFSAIARKHGLL